MQRALRATSLVHQTTSLLRIIVATRCEYLNLVEGHGPFFHQHDWEVDSTWHSIFCINPGYKVSHLLYGGSVTRRVAFLLSVTTELYQSTTYHPIISKVLGKRVCLACFFGGNTVCVAHSAHVPVILNLFKG